MHAICGDICVSQGATPLVPKFMRGVSTKQGNQQPTEGDDEVIHLNDPENSESASVENPDANPMSPKKAPKVINEPLDPQETIEVIKLLGYMICEYRTL